VHFAFEERQREFQGQLRALTDKSCTAADVREAWASDLGWSRPPEPLLETTALAVPLLVAASAPEAEERGRQWLPAVGAGDAVVTVGTAEMKAVPAAAGADLFLLESDDGQWHAVPAPDTTLTARASIDGGRRLAAVDWEPSPATLVATGADAAALSAALQDRAALGSAALLLGVADRLITMTAAYAVDRIQFGVPIGSFQAVKHHLANALIRLEFARPAVYRAAWSLDAGDPDASTHASMAKALASDAATGAAGIALQVHGAIGYTWEHDIHLWMKPAWALAAAWGDAPAHRARVLATLLGQGGDR
jgi:hypothetical protein